MYSTKVQNTKVYFSKLECELLFIGIILKTNTYLYGDAFVYSAVMHE